MKESHPVEVAEYARARGIDKEPAFEWWVPHTLKKRQVILSALKKRIRKTTHKYGIEIPTVGSHQVRFPMCTLETLQKYCSTGSLLLTFC